MPQPLLSQLVELQQRAWSVALRAALLPVGSLVRRRDRHLTWKLWEVASGAQRPGVYPEIGLGSLLSATATVSLQSLPNETYNVTELELLAISALARQAQARTVFEIGTADGRTTLNLANNAAPGGTVFTLNLPLSNEGANLENNRGANREANGGAANGGAATAAWRDRAGHNQGVPVGFHFLDRQTAASIVQLWGNSQAFDYADYLGRCELVFVDADHFEPGVTLDSQTALRLVDRRNGVIIWHDALRFDVQSALPRLARREGLPIHLIAGTNLAVLFFRDGRTAQPDAWAREQIS